MNDFAASWNLSRKRFLDEISGLSKNQLNWKLYPGSLSIGEMALHVAGVEVSFGSQLSDAQLDGELDKIRRTATDGVVNNLPFPFAPDEITPDRVARALDLAKGIWEPLIEQASPAVRQKEIKSALGPVISGDGAFARLGFHSAYHQGQAYLLKCAPGFPQQ